MATGIAPQAAALNPFQRRSVAGRAAWRYRVGMKQRQRKLAGMIACVIYLLAYCLVVMAVGGQFVVGGNGALELAFYALAGFAWLPVAMVIIKWLSRPDKA